MKLIETNQLVFVIVSLYFAKTLLISLLIDNVSNKKSRTADKVWNSSLCSVCVSFCLVLKIKLFESLVVHSVNLGNHSHIQAYSVQICSSTSL